MTSPHTEMLGEAYRAWVESSGSFDPAMLAVFSDDVAFYSAAEGGDGGDALAMTRPRQGRAGIEAYFAELAAAWAMQRFEVLEIIGDGDQLVFVCDMAWRNKLTGKLAEMKKVDIWTFADGLVVRFEEFYNPVPFQVAAQ